MKFTFLGTGTSSGVPMIACQCAVCTSSDFRDNRLRTSAMLEYGETRIIIDIGPDFRQQLLRNQVSRVDAILMTHGHKDHTAGLDEVRALNFMSGKEIVLYLDELTEKMMRNQYDYIFQEHQYKSLPKIQLHRISDQAFNIGGTEIQPFQVMHHKMPVTAFRFGDLTYITDCNAIAENEMEIIRGTRILVVNGLRKKKHLSHFTLKEALELAESLQVESCYITHISHQLGKHEEISAELPDFAHLAYDGLAITVA